MKVRVHHFNICIKKTKRIRNSRESSEAKTITDQKRIQKPNIFLKMCVLLHLNYQHFRTKKTALHQQIWCSSAGNASGPGQPPVIAGTEFCSPLKILEKNVKSSLYGLKLKHTLGHAARKKPRQILSNK